MRASRSLPLFALFTGALAIATSGIFVRLSETGPTATAFWRAALALPLLALWVRIERARSGGARAIDLRGADRAILWSGLFFTGDLYVWHWALLMTSIGAATLEANLAPVFVTLFAWIVYRERPSPRFTLALGLALAGVLLIVWPKLGPTRASLTGDVLGVLTAPFYAGYVLAVVRARATRSTAEVMAWSTLIVAVVLFPFALTQQWLPATWQGWALLAALAMAAQVLGQGLIAYALAYLPATFGAVGLYLQPLAASLYAWWLLGETLTPVQIAGGAIVIAAIALARDATRAGSM